MNLDLLKVANDGQRQLDAITLSARDAIQKHYTDPSALLRFIEHHETAVHCFPSWLAGCLRLLLGLLGFEPGFIVPSSNFRYRLLKTFLELSRRSRQGHISQLSMAEDVHGLFVLTPSQLKISFLSHQLYHWIAFRTGVPGYSLHSQQLYRKFWNEHQGQLDQTICHSMDTHDMLSLKAAINREMEALKFLRDILHEVLVPADQARQLIAGSTSV